MLSINLYKERENLMNMWQQSLSRISKLEKENEVKFRSFLFWLQKLFKRNLTR